MEFELHAKLLDHVIFKNKKIKLKTQFTNVLSAYAIANDDGLLPEQKISMCLNRLVKHRWYIRLLPLEEKNELLQLIFSEFVTNGAAKPAKQKSFDFFQDAKYIYSAFWQAYGINLFARHVKLHWYEFLSLFAGLPDNTRFMQIVEIRTRPMPKATKYNAEQRQQLARLKHEYRIQTTEKERRQMLQEGLANLAKTLEGMARYG